MNRVYMDHAATTKPRPEVIEAMLPLFQDNYGNPSSIYTAGRDAKRVLEEARAQIAEILGAKPEEIYFTSGGSEADNLALQGVAWANERKGRHLITSSIEHHAVYDTCKFLQKRGFEVTFVGVDEFGRVDPQEVAEAIREDTILISIMHANNEVGTIQPIAEIGEIAGSKGIRFHTDAVQTVGALPVNVDELQCDLLSLSAHKFYGPKGVGVLYARKGTRFVSHIYGGAQERGRRAGTENTPGIVGMAKALALATAERETVQPQIAALRDRLREGILAKVDEVRLNGHPQERLPNNLSLCFRYIEGEALLLNLDLQGIAGSSGSACTSGSLEPSHVLLAMGIAPEIAHGSLRLTLGRENTPEEVDYVIDAVAKAVDKLRQMSPLYEK
ncbi:MAG: cysteine desulfurase NifS [Limnochordia bacterium]|jgi:cysteine desulfurase|nr:cysteine desulfurase NifS [Limnochordia bacterium]MDD2629005.1 cysteine desulfurase NifS [Limnochordia bacterium]MDD4517753.1 cysteine desulfurase NifS [Limnochordia bacterium]